MLSIEKRSQVRYFASVAIVAFLAFSFHASVSRRFTAMQNGLLEASRLRHELNWDELKAVEYHLEAARLYRESINHTLTAFAYVRKAELLKRNAGGDEKDVHDLEDESNELKKEAELDRREGDMWATRSYADGIAYEGTTMTGEELAQQAKRENEEAQVVMAHAARKRERGVADLKKAQADLKAAEELRNETIVEGGVCKWFQLACKTARGGSPPSPGGNETDPNLSDDVIQANQKIQFALKEIHYATVEREHAMTIFRNASLHANMSVQILHEAQVFRNQSRIDAEEANAHHAHAAKENKEATEDELLAGELETEVTFETSEIKEYINTSNVCFSMAINEHYEALQVNQKLTLELAEVATVEEELEQKTEEAKSHVAKAGWYALVACIAGACLLVIVLVQIIASFRYQRPLFWIVRPPPHRMIDTLYLLNHSFIFVLSMGYVGELLVDFDQEDRASRAGITFLFACVAAIFQVSLLHLLPHSYKLFRESQLHSNNFRILLLEDILKKGAAVSLVFAIELLLVWVNVGSAAFKHAYQMNIWWTWIVVFGLAACYALYVMQHEDLLRTTDTSGYLDAFDADGCSNGPAVDQDIYSTQVDEQCIERQSLLSNTAPGSVQGSLQGSIKQGYQDSVQQSTSSTAQGAILPVPHPSPSHHSSSNSSMNSVPLRNQEEMGGYGALGDFNRSDLSISPEIRATFIASWRSELEKIRLLFEILVASWAVWIIRRDIELIVKFSPLVKGLAWGRCPLWILNIFLFVILIVLAKAYTNRRKMNTRQGLC
jgi:hypothetical protein